MIAPDRPKESLPRNTLSAAFSKAILEIPEATVSQRTEAYRRTADDATRTPWESLAAAIPGTLDLTHHPEVRGNDLPGRIDIQGDVIIDAGRLQDLAGKNINIDGNLILILPKSVAIHRARLQEDAWAIDGVSIGGEVILREQAISPTQKETTTETSKESEYARLAAMTREQFADYLTKHFVEYAKLSRRGNYIQEEVQDDELYELMIIKPSRRGRPTTELATPIFAEQIRAKRRYETELKSLIDLWNTTHNISEARTDQSSKSWGRWIINGGFPTKDRETTPKGYITLARGTVDLTPKHISELVRAVQNTGVKCQMKIPTDGTRLTKLFDNIVLHGTSQENVQKVIDAVQKYCDAQRIDIEATELGEDGEGTSHSARLVKRIREAWNPKIV